MIINTNDFSFMYRGKQLQDLNPQQEQLLTPIDIPGTKHERALLLLHGFASSPAVYRVILATLKNYYDAISAPVLTGHGANISAFAKSTSRQWIKSAESAYEKLSKDYKHIDVMGLSLGGLLACYLSTHYNIHHLYLLAPALSLHLNLTLSLSSAYILRALGINYLKNRAGNLCSPLHYELSYKKLPIACIIEILNMIKNHKFTPPSCPTDLFLGVFDKVVNVKNVEKYFTNLENCKIHWLQNSAHVLSLDTDLDAITDIICSNARN